MKADEFVSLAILGRDLAHLEHWKTKVRAEHEALAAFYEKLLRLLDRFVEQYQGYYGRRMQVELMDDDKHKDIRKTLESQVEWIEMNRYEVCDKDETALQNVIDEIVGLYQKTLYLLTLE